MPCRHAGRPDPSRGTHKPWLLALGRSLARVVIEDAVRQSLVAESAGRLTRTVFHVDPQLRVVPYLGQTPAGQPAPARAVWAGFSAVVADPSEPRYAKPLGAELARPFGDADVANAIQTCIGRDAEYVEQYVAENFDTSATAARPAAARPTPADADAEELPMAGELPPVRDRSAKGRPRPHHSRFADSAGPRADYRRWRARRPSLVIREQPQQRSAAGHVPHPPGAVGPVRGRAGRPDVRHTVRHHAGVTWDDSAEVYRGRGGRTISPVADPFKWEWRDPRGTLVRRIWFAEQRLAKGVEMHARVWEAIRASPTDTSVVLLGEDGTPEFITGETLLRRVNDREVTVLPSTYRLRHGNG